MSYIAAAGAGEHAAAHGMEDWRGIGENRHILRIVDTPSGPS